jgi:DNA-binding response OmpR family regulator
MKFTDCWPAGAQASGIPQPQPIFRERILVVEDDAMIRRMNGEVLTYSGYQVDTAEDGAAAWDAMQLTSYDLLLTDNEMPHLTGVGLLKKLHAARMALPVIMATGTAPEEELNANPWLPIDALLLKPYSFDELLMMVKKVLLETNEARGTFAPPPKWPNQPAGTYLQL